MENKRNSGKTNNAKEGNAKMNKNEKRWIVLLVAVLVIAGGVKVGFGMNGNKKDTAIGSQS